MCKSQSLISVADGQRKHGFSDSWIYQPTNKYKHLITIVDKIAHIDENVFLEHKNTAVNNELFCREMELFLTFLKEKKIIKTETELAEKLNRTQQGLRADGLLYKNASVQIFVKFRKHLPDFYDWKGYENEADVKCILEGLWERIYQK